MDRREFLSLFPGLAVSAECLSLEAGEQPLAISVTLQAQDGIVPRLTPEERRRIAIYFREYLADTSLDGLPILISDGIVKVDVVTDKTATDSSRNPRCSCNNCLMVQSNGHWTGNKWWCPHMDPDNQEVSYHLRWQEINEIPPWLCKFTPVGEPVDG